MLDRRGGTGAQGALVLVQGSGCTSVLNQRALEEARVLAPDRAVVLIERYGVPPGHAPDDIIDRRYVDDLLATDASILLIQSGRDIQSPPASSAPVLEAFERAGRTNLTYWEYEDYDHFRLDEKGVRRLPEVLERARD